MEAIRATATATPAAAATRRARRRASEAREPSQRHVARAPRGAHSSTPSTTDQRCSKRARWTGSCVVSTTRGAGRVGGIEQHVDHEIAVGAIELARRLVGEDQPRRGDEGACDRDALRLAARRARPGCFAREIGDADERQQRRAPQPCAAARDSPISCSGSATFSRTVSGGSRLGPWKMTPTGPGPQCAAVADRGPCDAIPSWVPGGRRAGASACSCPSPTGRRRRSGLPVHGAVGGPERDDRLRAVAVDDSGRVAFDERQPAHAATRPSTSSTVRCAASARRRLWVAATTAHAGGGALSQQRDDLVGACRSRARRSARRRAAAADRSPAPRRALRGRALRPRAAPAARARARRGPHSRAIALAAAMSARPPSCCASRTLPSTLRWPSRLPLWKSIPIERARIAAAHRSRIAATRARRRRRRRRRRARPARRCTPAAWTSPSRMARRRRSSSPGSAVTETPRSASVSSSPAW